MYFEPSKKTYYRFPSKSRVTDLNSQFFLQELPDNDHHNSDFEDYDISTKDREKNPDYI